MGFLLQDIDSMVRITMDIERERYRRCTEHLRYGF